MCYHPIKLPNPKLKSDNPDVKFDKSHDKVYLEVPCGQCGECLTNRMNDYFVRTYQEYTSTVNNGGYVFFDTFTYDEEHVPRFMDLLCFDASHYRQFMKNLRGKLYNKFGDYEFLKVFWVSEYGGITARSHYHALFFVQKPECDFNILNDLINSTWYHGFTQTNNPYDSHGEPNRYYNRPDLCLVDQNAAINYVSKYINKDIDFLTFLNKQKTAPIFKKHIQDLRYQEYVENALRTVFPDDTPKVSSLTQQVINGNDSICHQLAFDTRLQFDQFHPLIDISFQTLWKYMSHSDYNRFLPYKRTSQQFGVDLTHIDIEQLKKGYIFLEDTEQGLKRYRLPMYVDRKVFYNYNKDTRCYELNDLGKEMKKVRIAANQCNVQSKLPEFFNVWPNLCQDQTVINDILTRVQMRIDSSVQTVDDVALLVESLLDGRSWSEYVNYVTVYKNLCLPKDPGVVMPGECNIRNYELLELETPDYLDKNSIPYADKRMLNHFIDQLNRCTCGNCHPQFYNFDKLCDLYNLIRGIISDQKQKDYIEDKKYKSNIKLFHQLYNGKL